MGIADREKKEINDELESWDSPTKEEKALKGKEVPNRIEWDVIKIGFSASKVFSTELRYFIKDNNSIGGRLEVTSQDEFSLISIAGFYDYYEGDTSTKMFMGGGLGLFTGGPFLDPDSEGGEGPSLGIIPRLGWSFGIFRVSLEANLMLSGGASSYGALMIGFTINNEGNGEIF